MYFFIMSSFLFLFFLFLVYNNWKWNTQCNNFVANLLNHTKCICINFLSPFMYLNILNHPFLYYCICRSFATQIFIIMEDCNLWSRNHVLIKMDINVFDKWCPSHSIFSFVFMCIIHMPYNVQDWLRYYTQSPLNEESQWMNGNVIVLYSFR